MSKICKKFYYKYAPSRLTDRRNASLVKVPDYEIIALLVWQAEEGISSQRRFARCWGLCGLSRSRFNRRARALLGLTAQIVNDLKSRVNLSDQYMIIDSLPMPLCQLIRNRRAKVFEGTANIGYNSTKKFYYYGFKGHLSQDGYVLGYVITKASIHDAKEAEELIFSTRSEGHFILGDEGYIGKRLHDALKIDGYILWAPYRKNMKGAKQHNKRELMAIRRTIDSVFSVLKYYGIENILARSVDGFQQTVEIIVLTYNISYILQRYGFSFFN
ncbi:IS982 family transposase [Lactobacillus delbrueckii]|uniref:IS982 family transposase n=1 Tax=Lactobacillus delbrueckii TaxID=1584 RepID=UPI0022E3A81B|nr:IS982 family transposase [Lactobacillus delbrueckii]